MASMALYGLYGPDGFYITHASKILVRKIIILFIKNNTGRTIAPQRPPTAPDDPSTALNDPQRPSKALNGPQWPPTAPYGLYGPDGF